MRSLAELPVFGLDVDRPFALLADVHSNLEALSEVLRWLDAQGVEQGVVLGDVIGYGASPGEVMALLRRLGWPVLRGNHEDMFLDFGNLDPWLSLNERARRAICWTRQQLDGEARDYISTLPDAALLGGEAIAVHGSLVDPRHCHAYIYELSLDLNLRRLNELQAPAGTLVVYGHTHRPKVFRAAGEEWRQLDSESGELRLEPGAYHFVNPGSVGYPRDGDPRASFMVWHPRRRELALIRLPYDVAAAARKIRAAGYHDEIAARLLEAR